MQKVKTCFCSHCRKETKILWGKEITSQNIHGIQQELLLTVAVCKECGQNVCPHGLIDLNISEMEEPCKKGERS